LQHANTDSSASETARPTRQTRILTAIGIAVASGLVAYFAGRRQGAVPDFLYPWTGARLFLSGVDPYAAMGGHRGAAPPYDDGGMRLPVVPAQTTVARWALSIC